jgi:hypothetical protein
VSFLEPVRRPAADLREKESQEKLILELLRYHKEKYDEYQALVLAQMYDFKPGILYLFEKTEQYGQIVQYYMEKRAHAGRWPKSDARWSARRAAAGLERPWPFGPLKRAGPSLFHILCSPLGIPLPLPPPSSPTQTCWTPARA